MRKFIELTGLRLEGKRLFNADNIVSVQPDVIGRAIIEVVGGKRAYQVKESYEEVKSMLLRADGEPKVDEKLQELGQEILKKEDSMSKATTGSELINVFHRNNHIRIAIKELVESLNNHMHDNGYTTDASKIQLLKTTFNESEFNRLFELIAKYRVE